MKKTYLKWLLPIMFLFLAIGITCFIYSGVVRKNITDTELKYTASLLEDRLNETDIIVKTIIDYNNLTEVALQKLNYKDNKEIIVSLLEACAKNEMVVSSIICKSDGSGYNEKGSTVSLRGEPFFDEIKQTYDKGGKGLVLITDSDLAGAVKLAVVNSVVFNNDQKGYLISTVFVKDIAARLFDSMLDFDDAALISLSGKIVASYEKNGSFVNKPGDDFWMDKPVNISVEAIKLNISQKTKYISEIGKYGYIIAVPSKVTNGAVVIIMTHDQLSKLLGFKMRVFWLFVLIICLVIVLCIAIFALLRYLQNYLRKKKLEKLRGNSKRDELTGLYNAAGSFAEIDKYIVNSQDRRGLLFCLYVEDFSRLRAERGKEAADKIIRQFSDELSKRYRSSDIIGRISDAEFVIFMKDISDPKDIRKQVDELHMFLYDLKTDETRDEKIVNPLAGGAMYPNDGTDAEKLLHAARIALEKSKHDGHRLISF